FYLYFYFYFRRSCCAITARLLHSRCAAARRRLSSSSAAAARLLGRGREFAGRLPSRRSVGLARDRVVLVELLHDAVRLAVDLVEGDEPDVVQLVEGCADEVGGPSEAGEELAVQGDGVGDEAAF